MTEPSEAAAAEIVPSMSETRRLERTADLTALRKRAELIIQRLLDERDSEIETLKQQLAEENAEVSKQDTTIGELLQTIHRLKQQLELMHLQRDILALNRGDKDSGVIIIYNANTGEIEGVTWYQERTASEPFVIFPKWYEQQIAEATNEEEGG